MKRLPDEQNAEGVRFFDSLPGPRPPAPRRVCPLCGCEDDVHYAREGQCRIHDDCRGPDWWTWVEPERSSEGGDQ